MIMHYISGSFIFPVVMSVLDWVCLFIRETIQRVNFVTHMLLYFYLTKHHHHQVKLLRNLRRNIIYMIICVPIHSYLFMFSCMYIYTHTVEYEFRERGRGVLKSERE
jgi:hypothetical protein